MPLNPRMRFIEDVDEFVASEVDYVAMRVDAADDISEMVVNLALLPEDQVPEDDTTWHPADLVSNPSPRAAIGRLKIGPGTEVGRMPPGIYRLWMQLVGGGIRPAVPSPRMVRVRG